MLSDRIYTQKATPYDSLYGTFWEKPNDVGLGAGRMGLTGGALGNLWGDRNMSLFWWWLHDCAHVTKLVHLKLVSFIMYK